MIKDVRTSAVTQSHQDQMRTLKERGLVIENEPNTLYTLQHIDYFRIKGYYLHLRQRDSDDFIPGASFLQIVAVHNFDSKLRLLLLSLLFDIEIVARTRIAHSVGQAWGPFGYRDENNYLECNKKAIGELIYSIDYNLSRSKEYLILKFKKEHASDFPVWIAVEAMSFGDLSKLFSLLPAGQQKVISNLYKSLDEELFKSWVHAAAVLRNICAHNCRIYNRRMPIPIMMEKVVKTEISKRCPRFTVFPNSLFAYLLSMRRISDPVSWNSFLHSFVSLAGEYRDNVQMVQMGFPYEWEEVLLYK